MLYLENPRTIEWTTVFRDHVDANLYWYLPNHISIAQRGGFASFQLLRYAGSGAKKGGAFLQFEVNLRLPEEVEKKILEKIPAMFGDEWTRLGKTLDPKKITLNVPAWDDGSVECMALDLKGSGGTRQGGEKPAQQPPTKEGEDPKPLPETTGRVDDQGRIKFTEMIRGATRPSLDARNSAVFGVQLTEEGAQMVLGAFKNKVNPVGIFYDLKYTGMTPGFSARVTADMKRVYHQLSAKVEGQYSFVRGGIEAGLEDLVRTDAVKIEITDYATDKARNAEIEAKVISLVTDKIIAEWMKPVLTPGALAGAKDGETLDTVIERGKQLEDIKKSRETDAKTRKGEATARVQPAETAYTTARTALDTAGDEATRASDAVVAAKTKVADAETDLTTATDAETTAKKAFTDAGEDKKTEMQGKWDDAKTKTTTARDKIPDLKTALVAAERALTKAEETEKRAKATLNETKLKLSKARAEAGEPQWDALKPPDPNAINSAPDLAKIVQGATKAVAAVPTISFQLKAIRQSEQGTFTFDFNKRQAAQRIFAPEQLLGFLVEGLNESDPRYVPPAVTFDDPTFQKFEVIVDPPVTDLYAKRALKSVTAKLSYKAQQPVQYVFDASKTAREKYVTNLSGDQGYRVLRTFNFQDNETSGWRSKRDAQGREQTTYSYDSQAAPANASEPTNTVVNLDPTNDLKFIDVEIEVSDTFDWTTYPSVKLELRYRDYDAANLDHSKAKTKAPYEEIARSYVFSKPAAAAEGKTPTTEKKTFRLRVNREDADHYEYALTYRLKDNEMGTDLGLPWRKETVPRLIIDSPPTVNVELSFDTVKLDDVTRATINVTYRDSADASNPYAWQKKVSLAKAALQTHIDRDGAVKMLVPVRALPVHGTFDYVVDVRAKAGDAPWQYKMTGVADSSVDVAKPETPATPEKPVTPAS